jgi:hypothetical protein
MNWLVNLLSHSEREVDSLVVAGLSCVIAFIAVSIYSAVIAPAQFSPTGFGTGAGTILGAMAAGKGCRDRLAPPDPPV